MRPNNNRSGNTDGSDDGVSTAVIAHRDTSPIYLARTYFNRVSLFIQSHIVYWWMTAFGTCRDTRADFAFCLRIAEPVGIESFISK